MTGIKMLSWAYVEPPFGKPRFAVLRPVQHKNNDTLDASQMDIPDTNMALPPACQKTAERFEVVWRGWLAQLCDPYGQ